jgi:hypothetical protein
VVRKVKKKDLLSNTRQALLELAAGLNIRGRTRMTKSELAQAILKVRGGTKAAGAKQAAEEGQTPGKERRRKPLREKDLVRRNWREQQSAVQRAKFAAKTGTEAEPPRRAAAQAAPAPVEEVPVPEEEDRIILLVRDPYWVHVYWEISRQALVEAKAAFGDEWDGVKTVLRVYDVTDIDFDGENAHSHFDIEIGGGASNWYINTQIPNRAYCVDIGLISQSGRFLVLARSNVATTPRDMPSKLVDEEYMIPDWEFDKIYALSGGFSFDSGSGSIELKELIGKALAAEIGSGAPGSLFVSSPSRKEVRGRAFWFRVGTELIVYGATEPDARVTVQGRPVKLRPDGTFSLRFALPDGVQKIPATAKSADGVDEITITSTVEKRTDR